MHKVPGRPDFIVPAGSCDCHVHLFGPFDRFALARNRLYTPAPALTSDLLAVIDAAGVGRAVLVQPSAYGADNRCLLDALAAYPTRFRGVVVIDADIPVRELERMNALGVRGVRLNLATSGGRSAAETARLMDTLADKIAPLGWHLQVFIGIGVIAEIAPLLRRLPVDVVFDHMGMPQAALGRAQPGFAALLNLLESGRGWVKLSGPYRVSSAPYGNAEVATLARTLVAANRDRVVWGSDWPHIDTHPHSVAGKPPAVGYRPLDYGRLLTTLADWVRDDIARILADNAARLYDFA